ncbi:pyridoxamine 5'-phosphate oxidase family protein, partial [Mesorhizobium sp. M2D.F.Ca.ET.160.01.1.1]
MQIRTLSALECTKILTANRFGHLACAKDGQPYVVPFYFAHADNHLYAFSMPGKKIDWMRSNPLVSVQVEERGTGRG